ncbi:MAG: hypothetical protein ACM3P1_12295, partial [Candidatus Saccharibacteria bacterium]
IQKKMGNSITRFTTKTNLTIPSTILAGAATCCLSSKGNDSEILNCSQWFTLNQPESIPTHAWTILPFAFLKRPRQANVSTYLMLPEKG